MSTLVCVEKKKCEITIHWFFFIQPAKAQLWSWLDYQDVTLKKNQVLTRFDQQDLCGDTN